MLKIAVIVTNGWEKTGNLWLVHLVLMGCYFGTLKTNTWMNHCWIVSAGAEVFFLSFVSQVQVNPDAGAVVAGILLLLQCILSFGLLSCTRCNPGTPNLGNEWLIYCIALFSVNCIVIPNLPAIWLVCLKILSAQAIYAQEHRKGAHYLQST